MKAAVVDLDGTVYRSAHAVPGAVDGIESLRSAGVDIAFVSNTSSKSRATCCERLNRIGIECELEDIITSTSVTATSVARTYSNASAFVVGMEALHEELDRTNVATTQTPEDADVLIVGKDRAFDFSTLTAALAVLEKGAPFVVTNRDRTAPLGNGGIEPGTGAIVAAIETASGRTPDIVAGKPHESMTAATLESLGCDATECLMIGDNPETDIEMADRAGMTTVLVMSGVADRSDAERSGADFVVESLREIPSILASLDVQ